MKLGEVQTGQSAVVVKVLGHGGFRKRVVEMGFVKGKRVEVLLNAPLRDPVKYRVMGCEISLRRAEADMIEVVAGPSNAATSQRERQPGILEEEELRAAALRERRTINVCVVGNPNSGKTSLFNHACGAHERVGNYAGVTVGATEGSADFEGYHFNFVDLPGTYSLTGDAAEVLLVRDQLLDHVPDVVIDVLDAASLERNLYLTTQLIDMNLRMVCALNMYDELKSRGDKLDRIALSQLLGVPLVPTISSTGEGVERLMHVIINLYEGADFLDAQGHINPEVAWDIRHWHDALPHREEFEGHLEDFAHPEGPHNNVQRHIHINHGQYVEAAINRVKGEIRQCSDLRHKYSTRYLAIKLLEGDRRAETLLSAQPQWPAIKAACEKGRIQVEADTQADAETAIMDAKYGFVRGALREAGYQMGEAEGAYAATHRIDRWITHRWFGFPLFLLIVFIVFETTFSLGQIPMNWIDAGVGALADWLGGLLPQGALTDMLLDGIITGVGAVIVFLPQILILYFFIALMEDTGYMARTAFIMDRVMHGMGLHGKSFIPLMMGFGCNVPAVLTTHNIESQRSRIVTMLILPFMSCSARLPIYIMIVGAFFAPQWHAPIMLSLYAVGIVMAVVSARILSLFVYRHDRTPFVMELPPYRMPTAQAVLRHTWARGKEYLAKMGGVILVASIVVWALGYFPHHPELDTRQQHEQSVIAHIGRCISPLFAPQGFSWKQDVSLLAGIGAKEMVASTLSVLYGGEEEAADGDAGQSAKVRAAMAADGTTPTSAYAYLLFVLLYFPCIATIAAIRSETGSWRWAITAATYTTCVAWGVSALFCLVLG